MTKKLTIFDNEIRHSKKLLSGLHFVKTDLYFKETEAIRQKYENLICNGLHLNDEELLYKICAESNLNLPKPTVSGKDFIEKRPVHGLHISLNRLPFKPNKIINTLDDRFIEELTSLFNDNIFKYIVDNLPNFKMILNKYLTFVNFRNF